MYTITLYLFLLGFSLLKPIFGENFQQASVSSKLSLLCLKLPLFFLTMIALTFTNAKEKSVVLFLCKSSAVFLCFGWFNSVPQCVYVGICFYSCCLKLSINLRPEHSHLPLIPGDSQQIYLEDCILTIVSIPCFELRIDNDWSFGFSPPLFKFSFIFPISFPHWSLYSVISSCLYLSSLSPLIY